MRDQPFIDRLMADISGRLPTDLGGLRSEVERNVRSVLAEAVSRLDLITREEFDIQQQVLMRTREKLEALEKQVAELEKTTDACRHRKRVTRYEFRRARPAQPFAPRSSSLVSPGK